MPPPALLDHLMEIEERIAESPGLLLISDFDGSLAPIVSTPDKANLSPASRRFLSELSTLQGVTVAIVSGRALEDIRTRVGLDGITYAGNHGLEISGPHLAFIAPRAAGHTAIMVELAAALTPALRGVEGAWVENKQLTLSVHLRQVHAERVEEARRIVSRIVEEATERLREQVRLTEGRKVLEILPRIEWDKGRAVAFLRERVAPPGALVIALGDDATDEEMFRALGEDGITIKVGRPESTSAAFFVEDPSETERFLRWLVETIRRRRGGSA